MWEASVSCLSLRTGSWIPRVSINGLLEQLLQIILFLEIYFSIYYINIWYSIIWHFIYHKNFRKRIWSWNLGSREYSWRESYLPLFFLVYWSYWSDSSITFPTEFRKVFLLFFYSFLYFPNLSKICLLASGSCIRFILFSY